MNNSEFKYISYQHLTKKHKEHKSKNISKQSSE